MNATVIFNNKETRVLRNIKYFKMSDVSNTLYAYIDNRKVHSIWCKKNIVGIINNANFMVYLETPDVEEATKEKRLTMFEVIIPEFSEDESIIIAAQGYEHNTYTDEVIFYVNNGGYREDVAAINYANICGIQKYEWDKPEVQE